MVVIKNLKVLYNGYAIVEEGVLINGEPQIIMSGLEYEQAEREYLRIRKEKEKEALRNGVLQN